MPLQPHVPCYLLLQPTNGPDSQVDDLPWRAWHLSFDRLGDGINRTVPSPILICKLVFSRDLVAIVISTKAAKAFSLQSSCIVHFMQGLLRSTTTRFGRGTSLVTRSFTGRNIQPFIFCRRMATTDVPKAEYRQLGKSGLRVSVPILGAMSFGDKRWQPWVIEEDAALPMLKDAYDRGLNSWDTANVYSNGESERIIAKAIKKYNIPRHKLIIMTKCCGTTRENNEPETLAIPNPNETVDYINQRGLSRAGIFNAVNASLKRLDTDYIDLLQIHRFDPTTPIAETMKALHDLVESGKVRYIGASSMWTYQLAQMQFTAEKNGWTPFVSMQNHYSLLYREEEREMNKYCNETGVGLIPWGPLNAGRLARPAADTRGGSTSRSESQKDSISDQEDAIIGRVEELAKKKDWTMSQVALAWINKRVSSPIIGFSKTGRIDEALSARGKTLTDEEERYLSELYKPRPVLGHS